MAAEPGLARWRDRRVLVTGIGGFVGSGLAGELVDAGALVVGIVRDSGGLRMLQSRSLGPDVPQVQLVRGSITEPGLVQRAINEYEVDTVFHLAAQAIVGVANRSPVSTFESNIAGTWQVLEAARTCPTVERIVVASSDKVYGDQPVLPYTESTPLAGTYPYDASKVCADVLARCYAATFQMPIAVARCANIYGPGDLNWSRLIPGTIRSVLLGEAPVIRSDGTPERDYIYLADAIHFYQLLADRSRDWPGQAFNVGSGTAVSALALVTRILSAAGRIDLSPRILGSSNGEINRQCLSSARVRDVLGWEPSVDLSDGIDLSIKWYRDYLGASAPESLGRLLASKS